MLSNSEIEVVRERIAEHTVKSRRYSHRASLTPEFKLGGMSPQARELLDLSDLEYRRAQENIDYLKRHGVDYKRK